MLCVFVTPEFNANQEKIDLVAFHAREGRNYLWAMMAFCFVALAFNFTFSGFYGSWVRDSIITITGGGLTMAAIFFQARWVQIGAAACFAALATYFLIAASTLGTA
ncbi:hypothetical protein [Candidatus Viadribacter manganicus]|uniref:Uncharacterized protein n=1 Tax=Candidatus Viadribacter manganicus TaxID=1759059 RepID=A0A1B1AEW5_9PROT|nr:hypothetical protein [Candidatus Viadribacter manganicus]ANP45092.1 hypothetical protein ATE48_03730 [Candidatus Viadribacter manganicus]